MQGVSTYRLSELAQAAGFGWTAADLDEVTVTVGGHHFVEAAVCCGAPQAVRRFVPIGEPAGNCVSCGRPRQVARLLARPTISLREALLDDREPLTRRGAATARWITLEGPRRAVALRGPLPVDRRDCSGARAACPPIP